MATLHTNYLPIMSLLVGGSLAACSTLQVTSDTNSKTSITGCHTYAWAAETPMTRAARMEANPVNAARLHAAIDTNLAAKGLQPVADRVAADCVIGFAVGTREVVEDFGGPPYGWGWGMGWGFRHRGFVGWDWEEPYVYREGLIAVDLYDVKSRLPVWHAVVNQDISHLTGAQAEAKINAAVAAIFAKFPAGPPTRT